MGEGWDMVGELPRTACTLTQGHLAEPHAPPNCLDAKDIPSSAPFFKHSKSRSLKVHAPTTHLLPKHTWLGHDTTAKIKLREVPTPHTPLEPNPFSTWGAP